MHGLDLTSRKWCPVDYYRIDLNLSPGLKRASLDLHPESTLTSANACIGPNGVTRSNRLHEINPTSTPLSGVPDSHISIYCTVTDRLFYQLFCLLAHRLCAAVQPLQVAGFCLCFRRIFLDTLLFSLHLSLGPMQIHRKQVKSPSTLLT